MLNNINMVLDYILAINGFDSQYVYFPLSKTKIIEEIDPKSIKEESIVEKKSVAFKNVIQKI